MAIFRPGPLVDAISGAVGGVEFARNRGNVAKKRQLKKHKVGPGPTEARVHYDRAISAWQDLTDEQRLLWRHAATVTPIVNRLGQPRTLTGLQLFVRTAIVWRQGTGAFPTEPPEIYGQTPLSRVDITFAQPSGISVQCFTPDGAFNLGTAIIRVGWLLNRPLWVRPRSWRNVWAGTLTTGPDGGKAQLYPNPDPPNPVQFVTWPDDLPPPTEDWTIVVQAVSLPNALRGTGWVQDRALITTP